MYDVHKDTQAAAVRFSPTTFRERKRKKTDCNFQYSNKKYMFRLSFCDLVD